MEKVKVKGSPQYRMKVVAHRPLRQFLINLLLVALACIAIAATYFVATERAARTMLSPDEAIRLRAEAAQSKAEAEELRQQIAKYEVTLQVDREASKDIRQQALAQREKIDALKRDIAVYRMMTSKNNTNPMGIGFGIFSIAAQESETATPIYKLKLTVQKLAEGDKEFTGQLAFTVVGVREGQEQKIPLYQLAVAADEHATLSEQIPLAFKFFQKIETRFHLPEGFNPLRVELRVVADGKPNITVAEAQLSWPEIR